MGSAHIYLAAAICSEVLGTLSLKASEGFSKWPFTVAVVVGYVLSFVLLNLALVHGMQLSVAYGIWAAAGVASVALLSVPLFGDTLTYVQIVGLGLVIVGVVAVEAGGRH